MDKSFKNGAVCFVGLGVFDGFVGYFYSGDHDVEAHDEDSDHDCAADQGFDRGHACSFFESFHLGGSSRGGDGIGDGSGPGENGSESDFRPGCNLAFGRTSVAPFDTDIELFLGHRSIGNCVDALSFIFRVVGTGEGVDELLRDIEGDIGHGHELVEVGCFEDIHLSTSNLISRRSDFGLKGNFIGEHSHSAKDEDTDEQDIHAHGGLDQRECALGSGFGRLSHGLVVGGLLRKL